MSSGRKKCFIVAPYWHLRGHLGQVRTERFVRWLSGCGVDISLACCAAEDGVVEQDWGTEIGIRDPLKFYKLKEEGSKQNTQLRKDNPLRRIIAYLLLVPDPLVIWSRRAAKHKLVEEHAADSDWVLSSSPPESVHVASEKIAKGAGAKFVVDFRDGWLDEPFIPLIRGNPVQRWRHRRLERRILRKSSNIFVTNEIWKELLAARYPDTAEKTFILTNAYPTFVNTPAAKTEFKKPGEPLTLLYAGRIRSRTTQRESDILQPLLESLRSIKNAKGKIVFLGAFSAPEIEALNEWEPRFQSTGWTFEIKPAVSREEAMTAMREADGLLLLSTFHAPVPAKFFEYVAAQRPILASVPKNGMVGRYSDKIRQMFVMDLEGATDNDKEVESFFDCCRECREFDLPEEFTEKVISNRFLSAIGLQTGGNAEF